MFGRAGPAIMKLRGVGMAFVRPGSNLKPEKENSL
jgi:hypothetical protein